MADLSNPLIAALAPLTERVRSDVTAVKHPDGGSRWTHDAITPDRMARHLNGGPARGVSFIRPGESTTLVGLLDFDSHGGEVSWDAMSVTACHVFDSLCLAHGAEPLAFRSSGGRGVHIYVVWDEPQDARSVRQWLGGVLSDCGLRSGTRGVHVREVEVFPKQDAVPVGGWGNQVILPLAGQSQRLLPCELSGSLVLAGSELQASEWRGSPPVPVVAPAPRVVLAPPSAAADAEPGERAVWLQALDAIPNGVDPATGTDLSLGYDDWLKCIFAIHWELGGAAGDPRAWACAVAFTERSPKADVEWLAARVWPYITPAGGAGGGAPVTGGSVCELAARLHGWRPPEPPLVPFPPAVDPATGTSACPGPADSPAWPASPNASLDAGAAVVSASPSAAHPTQPLTARAMAHATETLDASPAALQRLVRQGIPPAKHLCTDQANANRLVKAYGAHCMVAAGKWYLWDGRVWAADEAGIYRHACTLSAIINAEADAIIKRASDAIAIDGNTSRGDDAKKIADALRKWSTSSEMKGTIEAAVGLARKMLTVDADCLDANPWLLNVANGIVNLRTGALMPHAAREYMTKLCPVAYYPAAATPGGADGTDARTAASALWSSVVLQITRSEPVAQFLQRWFGYCATGLTREQKFVVHWGDGSNGKSTLLDTIAAVLGPYASAAAPGLVAGGQGDRHPTEVAGLHGRRMVSASETKDGAALNEDFVKRATGDAKITARFMREDFFEFTPTHKIQLVTNSKPVIKGQDHGIWRRVLLVAYTARFGTAEEVAGNKATAIKNDQLLAELSQTATQEAVMSWLIDGAVQWAARGLQEPEAVVEASLQYRRGQDRVQAFLSECCELGAEFSTPMTLGMGGAYPTYVAWAKDSGTHPLSRARFLTELERTVPGLYVQPDVWMGAGGKRRRTTILVGLRCLDE